jgi:CubicO group peptidase (beta-lactamase class C family)
VTSLGLSETSALDALHGAVAEVAEQLDRWDVPGMSIAAVKEGEVVYAGGVGLLQNTAPQRVTARTLFHHGSCCKGYTSLLACLLAAEGLLDLDAPVRTWVPELRLPSEDVAAEVTVRDLLAHRSGLSRHDLTWLLNSSWDTAELVRRLEHLPLSGGLREKWDYSNLGYALAGLAIERAGGGTWSEQLSARVLAPAGMVRTTTFTEQMRADTDAASPHLLHDGAAFVVTDRAVLAAAPAGALMTCADDAARWLLTRSRPPRC